MSSRREQIARPYTESEIAEQNIFIEKFPNIAEELKDLFDKYNYTIVTSRSRGTILQFILHQYETCGRTQGLNLWVYPDIETWDLVTYLESGYVNGETISQGNLDTVESITEGFGPTRYYQG